MSTKTQKGNQGRLLIQEDLQHQTGFPILYRLHAQGNESDSHFSISVTIPDEETCEVDAGSDLLRALNYYRRIKDGNVTPCTLTEILQDLRYLDNF